MASGLGPGRRTWVRSWAWLCSAPGSWGRAVPHAGAAVGLHPGMQHGPRDLSVAEKGGELLSWPWDVSGTGEDVGHGICEAGQCNPCPHLCTLILECSSLHVLQHLRVAQVTELSQLPHHIFPPLTFRLWASALLSPALKHILRYLACLLISAHRTEHPVLCTVHTP